MDDRGSRGEGQAIIIGRWEVTCSAVWGRSSHVSFFKLVIMDTVPGIKKKNIYYGKKNWIGLPTANLRVCCALFPLPLYVFCMLKVLVFLYVNESKKNQRVTSRFLRLFSLFLSFPIFFFFSSSSFGVPYFWSKIPPHCFHYFLLNFFFYICY